MGLHNFSDNSIGTLNWMDDSYSYANSGYETADFISSASALITASHFGRFSPDSGTASPNSGTASPNSGTASPDSGAASLNSGTASLISVADSPKSSSTSSPPAMLPPCRVCGEKASGFHYGVNTCEACKVYIHSGFVHYLVSRTVIYNINNYTVFH